MCVVVLMVLPTYKNDKSIASCGNFEIRKRGDRYVLVRYGYPIMILDKKELYELKRVIEISLKTDNQF